MKVADIKRLFSSPSEHCTSSSNYGCELHSAPDVMLLDKADSQTPALRCSAAH